MTVKGVEFFTPFTFEFKTLYNFKKGGKGLMAKKIANPGKLKAEIALQQSKMKSLEILNQENFNED